MKLVIHCGLHKTGTTSFQLFCSKNRAALHDAGIHYPEYKKEIQHSHLMWDAQREGLQTLGDYLRESRVQADPECHTVLLSGEDFENCIIDLALAAEIEALARDAGYKEITWVVVVRPMADLVLSFYAQKCKRGVTLNLDTVQKAALERGCFYSSNADYDYIHVLDYQRYAARFQAHVAGQVIEYSFSEFVEGYPGKILLKDLLSETDFASLNQRSTSSNPHENRRLRESEVEENYIATALGIRPLNGRRRVFRPLLAPLVWLRRRRFRAARDALGLSGGKARSG